MAATSRHKRDYFIDSLDGVHKQQPYACADYLVHADGLNVNCYCSAPKECGIRESAFRHAFRFRAGSLGLSEAIKDE